MSLRLLFLLREEYPTYRVDVDVLFAQEIASRGHLIELVMQAASTVGFRRRIRWRSATVNVGRTVPGHGALRRIARLLLGIGHDVASLGSLGRFDAVQVRDKFLIGAIALLLAKLRGRRFFFWLSFPYPEDDLSRARARTSRSDALVLLRGHVTGWLLYRWILKHCDHAFVQSERMRADVCAHGVDSGRVSAVPMGIARSDIVAPRIVEDADSGTLTVVHLGTLNRQRRLGVLIDMLKLLRDAGEPIELLFVGDGEMPEDRASLEHYATNKGVREWVTVTGQLPRAVALERVKAASVGISPFYPVPTLLSASPTKLIEYMALGLPVIANKHPDQRLVLSGSRAGLCVPWNARHFALAVRWMRSIGPQRRAELGERGRRWVIENRTYARIADGVERVYADQLPSRVSAGAPPCA